MLRISSPLLAAFAISAMSGTAFANGDTPMSPNGAMPAPATEGNAIIKPSFGNSGSGIAALEASGVEVGIDPTPRGGLKTVASGVGGRSGRESIINWDSRTRSYTRNYPSRAIVLIRRNGRLHCTGWMISKNTLATAGHCVHTGGTSGSWYARNTLTLHPGADGSRFPYGTCRVVFMRSVRGWTRNRNPEYDYGAIRLSCDVGDKTGWFGMYHKSNLYNEPAIIGGYPGDKRQQNWTSADKVRDQDRRMIGYRMDTIGGFSGSPIWHDRSEATHDTGAWAIAVHAYGTGLNRYNNMNSGPRLYSARIRNYVNWINE